MSIKLPLSQVNYFTFSPLLGTKSYQRLEENEEIDNVYWDNFYVMGAAYTPPGIAREELLTIKRIGFLRFYLHPGILIENLLCVKDFCHFKFLLKRFYSGIIVPLTL